MRTIVATAQGTHCEDADHRNDEHATGYPHPAGQWPTSAEQFVLLVDVVEGVLAHPVAPASTRTGGAAGLTSPRTGDSSGCRNPGRQA